MRFYFVPRHRYERLEKVWPPAYLHTYQRQWLKAEYEVAKRLQKEVGFDVVHRLTYIGFRVPGDLWRLDAPFVWGPIGGLEQTTWRLLPALGLRGCLYYIARNLLNDWDRRFKRSPKLAFAKAGGGIIAATEGIRRQIKRFYGLDSTVVSEIGLPPIVRLAPVEKRPSDPLRLIWCGNHLAGKALPFLLDALEQLPPDFQWRLTVVGDGPLTGRWKRLAIRKGLNGGIDWLGRVSREKALQEMQSAHALIITSVYDLTSTVLVEALANGLPVVCPDHCGFADAITNDCGIKVPATSKNEIVSGIRDAFVLLNDESFRLRLAQGALSRSRDYEWDTKGRIANEIYRSKHLVSMKSKAAVWECAQ
jgi:glycosyltransferase involved in cell wall biosynthesis